MKCMILRGNLKNGFKAYGPFDSKTLAQGYIKFKRWRKVWAIVRMGAQ